MSLTRLDVNVALGYWPFQPHPYDTLEKLSAALQRSGVGRAWVASVEAILSPDPSLSEASLFAQLRAFPGLLPVKTAHPLLAGEQERIVRAHRDHQIAAVRIYPSYHQAELHSPAYVATAKTCLELGLPLLIVVRINDERNQPPLMQVPPVPVDEIVAFARSHPRLRVVALGADKIEVQALADGPENLYFDLSYLDGGSTMEAVAQGAGQRRLLFGSNTPFFYPEAAALKLVCSDLPEELLERLNCPNPFDDHLVRT